MSTPYNERTLQIVRDIVDYKRATIASQGYVEGGDSVDIMANLLATIDALAERLAAAEEQARVNPQVATQYKRRLVRRANAWVAIEPHVKAIAERVGDKHVNRDDVTLKEMVWSLAAEAREALGMAANGTKTRPREPA